MKKDYCKPTMNVVKIQHSGIICTSLTTTSTNLADEDEDLIYGGGGYGPAR